jgi:hypothetical protein
MDVVVVAVVLFVVVLAVTAPLRRARPDTGPSSELAELAAAREAKYREIRDAELDHRTGKLSDADYEALDSGLRAEAIEILHRIDGLGEGGGEPAAAAPG